MHVPLLAVTQPTCVAASSHRASNPNPCNGDNGDGASQECLLMNTEKKIRWCGGDNGSYKYV